MKLYRLKHLVIILEISKNTKLNKRTCHNLQSHLACLHIKMCTLIKHSICESMVKILTLQTRMLVDYVWKFPKKRRKIKGPFITCGYIWDIYISKYIYWLEIHSMNVWWIYVLHKHRPMFSNCPKKESRKLKIRTRYDKLG